MSKWTVVLTGGIGSGKSVVATLFEQLGIDIVEQDQISRDIVEPGTDALRSIVDHFGEDILLEDGFLNRARLRQLVFDDTAERRWLERLTHPLVGQRTVELIESASSKYVIVVNPLMRSRSPLYDRVLVVDVPEEVQIRRTIDRDNIGEELAKTMIGSQLGRQARLALADDVLTNDGTIEDLVPKVQLLHNRYLELSDRSLEKSTPA